MTEDRVNPAGTDAEPSNQASTDVVGGVVCRIQESTDELLESASAGDEKETGKEGAEREELLRVTSLVHRNGWLVETVYKPDQGKRPLRFNYYHPGKRREFGSLIPFDINKIKPPLLDDMVRQRVILLPSKGIPMLAEDQSALVDRLIRFIHRYLDIPPFWEKMIAHYILMTWVYDRFTAVPYLRLVSEHGTGKSRFLQVVGALCYKSVICGGSVSVAAIFRLTDQWRGTLAVDECDFNQSNEWVEIVKLLNCGYMAGMPAVRAESVGRSFAPRAFHVFGPKIIAGRHRFTDSALESRCLTYTPEERKLRDDIPRQLPPGFWDEALDLRNQLLGWRFQNFDAIRVNESSLLHLDPRLAQIGTTIYSVTKDEVFRDEFLRFLSDFGQEDRAERPQSVVVEAIRDLAAIAADSRDVLVTSHANGEQQLAGLNSDAFSFLTVKAVTERVNAIIQERGGNQIWPKRVGGIIRSLGFKPKRAREGYRFSPDPKRIEDLVKKYVPESEE